jgi:hypothetical protein
MSVSYRRNSRPRPQSATIRYPFPAHIVRADIVPDDGVVNTPDITRAGMTDTRWMTYDELATALSIAPDSARRLVARKKWPRKAGNDGRARIGIPAERIPDKLPAVTPGITPDASPDATPDTSSAAPSG